MIPNPFAVLGYLDFFEIFEEIDDGRRTGFRLNFNRLEKNDFPRPCGAAEFYFLKEENGHYRK